MTGHCAFTETESELSQSARRADRCQLDHREVMRPVVALQY
jgi:hypothetical protein